MIYNDTETRRIHLNINGDNDDINFVKLEGIRCLDDCTTPVPDDEVVVESEFRLWSKLEDWEGRPSIPADDEEIIIPSHWRMLYDIKVADSPRLKSLEINGQLIFLEGEERILKTHNLWVRAGYLQIGNETHPFPDKATIELQGDNTENFFAFTRAIEAGNKNLVITSDVSMVGLPRNSRTRLQSTIYRGLDQFLVAPGLDW